MRIYVYGEQCSKGGQVFCGDDDEAEAKGADLFIAYEGDDDVIICEARQDASNSRLDWFRRKTALNVLDWLGVSD